MKKGSFIVIPKSHEFTRFFTSQAPWYDTHLNNVFSWDIIKIHKEKRE